MKVTAKATRTGDWWAVEVPEVPGAFTQAKRLEQVSAMVQDAVSMLEDVDAESVQVDVVPQLPAKEQREVERVRKLASQAQVAEEKAARSSRAIVAKLRAEGLTVRDVGTVLGLSPSRVSQLANSKRSEYTKGA